MNNINRNNTNKQPKEMPLSKNLMNLSSFYLLGNSLIKNRGSRFTTEQEEVRNRNNIVIERDGYVIIYCNEEKKVHYEKEIKWIKKNCKIYNLEDNRIKIVAEDTNENCYSWFETDRALENIRFSY